MKSAQSVVLRLGKDFHLFLKRCRVFSFVGSDEHKSTTGIQHRHWRSDVAGGRVARGGGIYVARPYFLERSISMARQLRITNSPPSTARMPYAPIDAGASHPTAGTPYIPTASVGTPYIPTAGGPSYSPTGMRYGPTADAGTLYIPTAGIGTPYIPTAGGPSHSQTGTRYRTSVHGGP